MRPASSASADAAFPWGTNNPTRLQRIAVATALAAIAGLMHYSRAAESGGFSDFTSVWYGAKLLLEGRNPYDLIGPGRLIPTPSPAFYPAPAFVAVAPFTVFSFHWGSTAFVFLSTALLAWGATADGWHRLPLFPSMAFLTSVQLGQWSVLFTAAVFIPALSFVAIAKPQASMPVVAGSSSRAALAWAVAGAAVLFPISLLMLPRWPADWWSLIGTTDHFVAPVFRFGGPAILLVLLRWRRPEAWLIMVAACVPQTWYPYNSLILLTVAATYREASMLSLISSTGWIIAAFVAEGDTRSPETRAVMGAMLIAACYLPATIVVLRRPNIGPLPFWFSHRMHQRDTRRAPTSS